MLRIRPCWAGGGDDYGLYVYWVWLLRYRNMGACSWAMSDYEMRLLMIYEFVMWRLPCWIFPVLCDQDFEDGSWLGSIDLTWWLMGWVWECVGWGHFSLWEHLEDLVGIRLWFHARLHWREWCFQVVSGGWQELSLGHVGSGSFDRCAVGLGVVPPCP